MSVISATRVNELLGKYAQEAGHGAEVLEAGCGRFKHFDYPDSMVIHGLDISEDQLRQNSFAHEKYLGDVQTYQLEKEFDVVVSIFVLEHLEDPEAALRNMLKWTKPGGMLILAVPNALSLKGLVTKYTPFWFHHFFYKFVYRREYSIFPTTMKFSIAPRALYRFFSSHEIVLEEYSKERLSQPFHFFYTIILLLLRVLSLGKWHPERSNFQLVVRKSIPGHSSAAL
jgi:2-polyprenyl-3-methyl-5-hydroxy-6-metoxy-1,4-benzoquinol methylase